MCPCCLRDMDDERYVIFKKVSFDDEILRYFLPPVFLSIAYSLSPLNFLIWYWMALVRPLMTSPKGSQANRRKIIEMKGVGKITCKALSCIGTRRCSRRKSWFKFLLPQNYHWGLLTEVSADQGAWPPGGRARKRSNGLSRREGCGAAEDGPGRRKHRRGREHLGQIAGHSEGARNFEIACGQPTGWCSVLPLLVWPEYRRLSIAEDDRKNSLFFKSTSPFIVYLALIPNRPSKRSSGGFRAAYNLWPWTHSRWWTDARWSRWD